MDVFSDPGLSLNLICRRGNSAENSDFKFHLETPKTFIEDDAS